MRSSPQSDGTPRPDGGPPNGRTHVVVGHCHATACPCHGACSLLAAHVLAARAFCTVPGAQRARAAQAPACRRQPPPPAWRLVLPTGKCGKSDYKKSLDNYELQCSGGTHRPVLAALTALFWLQALPSSGGSRCPAVSQPRVKPSHGRGRRAGHATLRAGPNLATRAGRIGTPATLRARSTPATHAGRIDTPVTLRARSTPATPAGRIDPGNVRWNRVCPASSANYAPLRGTWPPGPTPLPYFR